MLRRHQSRPGIQVFCFTGLLALVVVGVFAEGGTGQTTVPVHASPAQLASAPLLSPTPTCLPLWSTISNPPEESRLLTLESIATLSENNAWAVGYQRINAG